MGFRREKSPKIHCVINNQHVICIIDEGSVINCCSYAFAKKANIPIENVSCAAVGANKSPMNVIGIAKYDINATVVGTNMPSKIKIATLIVINDLGAEVLLLGQPTKVDNQIVTIPHNCSINFKSMEGDDHSLSCPLQDTDQVNLHDVVKVDCSTTIFPSESYTQKLPDHFCHQSKVCFTGRPSSISWITSQIVDVDEGCINITNNSQKPVYLKKHAHIADVKNVAQCNVRNVNRIIPDQNSSDHLEPYEDWDYSENFVTDIKLDPDNVMSKEWKAKFRKLCESYSDIINYRPARYNGFYGDVDNSIDFSSIPPVKKKIYTPKYSDKMNQILANKMDQLEQVLQCRKKAPAPYTEVQPCLLFDLKTILLLSSLLFDFFFFMCIAAIRMYVAEYGARPTRCS